MTVIPSIEALEAMPEGEQITVRSRRLGSQRWTKDSSGGFSRESVMVGAVFFEGYITEGRVTRADDTPAGPGQWFTAAHRDYYLLALTDTGNLSTMTFYNGVYQADSEYQVDQFNTSNTRVLRMQRLDGPPDRVLADRDSVRQLLDRMHDRLTATSNQLAAAREQLQAKPEREKSDREAAVAALIAAITDIETAWSDGPLAEAVRHASAVASEHRPPETPTVVPGAM